MKIRCFEDTDTQYVELRDGAVAETRGLDENTRQRRRRPGADGCHHRQHAEDRAELANFVYERVES